MNKYFITAFVILVLALLFWYSIALQDLFFGSVESLRSYANLHPLLAQVIFVVLAVVSAMLSPFSSVPLVPIAVVIWGGFLTFSLLLLGWLVGGALTYYTGRYVAYPILRRFFDIESKADFYRKKFSPKTEFALVYLFRLASPADLPGYVLGAIRYSFGKYFLATLLAEVPLALIAVYASEAVVFRQPLLLTLLGIIALGLFGGGFYWFRKKLRS